MTAIVSALTPEGFVLAADGRQKLEGQLVSDSETKIAPFEANNVRAVYALHGATRFGSRNVDFDFKEESRVAQVEMQNDEFVDLSEFVEAFSLRLYNRFDLWIRSIHASLGDMTHPEIVSLVAVGYVSGVPQIAVAHFDLEGGHLQTPVLELFLDNPEPHFKVFSGHKSVYDIMLSQGAIHPCNSLTEAQDLVTRYIQGCADSPNDESNSIGGHIHVAAVEPSTTFWLKLPAPSVSASETI